MNVKALLRKIPFVFLFLLVCMSTKVAATEKELIDSGSLRQQFDFVINKSTPYNEYRAVRSVWLGKLKTHALDTIQHVKTQLLNYQKLSAFQAKQIDSLTNSLSLTGENLDKATLEKNSLRIFGIKIAKYKYNSIVTFIILGLLAVVIFGFIAYKRRNAIANQSVHDLANLKEEFESFRKRALEREQKMARQHLDEILKYKDKSVRTGKS
jgi:hypothetical protein